MYTTQNTLFRLTLQLTFLLCIQYCIATQITSSPIESLTQYSNTYPYVKSQNDTNDCTENSDCNNQGICDSGVCVCDIFYSGKHCSEDWRQDKVWVAWFTVYSLWAAGLQAICLIYASWQLWITLKFYHDGGWVKWSLTTYISIIAMIAGFLRVFIFLIDPHDIRGYFGRIPEEFFFNVPIIMWLAAGFMIFLYWLELQNSTGIKQLVFISKFRSFLGIFISISVVLLIPITFWKIFNPGQLAYTIYNASLALIFVFLVICLTASGLAMIRTIRATYKSAVSNSRMDSFLRQLLRYIVVLDIFIVLAIFFLILFVLVEAQTNKWKYVGLHTILRLNEFSIVISTLIFIKKKKPAAKATTETGTNLSRVSVMFSKSATHEEDEQTFEDQTASTKEVEMESVVVEEDDKMTEVPVSS